MRVDTKQEATFLDGLIQVPESELDVLEAIIDWSTVGKKLQGIKGDYKAGSLFKMMLLQTWHNLSDISVCHAISRDLVFMRFCDFTLEDKKPDASTLCRFRNRLVKSGKLGGLLNLVNQNIEAKGLKLADGKYISTDATLIQSSPHRASIMKVMKPGLIDTKPVRCLLIKKHLACGFLNETTDQVL